MNSFNRGIVDLIKSGISGKAVTLPPDFDWDTAEQLGLKHQVLTVMYYGVVNSGLSLPQNTLSELENCAFQCVAFNQRQLYEIENIYKAFDENKIEYMPLKGLILKSIYPKPELRQMSDADILIKPEQYGQIKPIMQSLGFVEAEESDHELAWNKKGRLYVELHKRLIPSHNKDYFDYYDDGWRLASRASGTRYDMSDEDCFIFLFTHYAKHFRNGGIGIRHITDLYVFLLKKPDINKAYIESELDKLCLKEFYENTMKTVDVWFENAFDSEITDFITEMILTSGSYGTHDNQIVSQKINSASESTSDTAIRTKELLSVIFPSYSTMIKKYGILKKCPILLPAMWIVRLVNAMLFKRKVIGREKKNLKLLTADNISDYKEALKFVGLNTELKE